MNFPPNIFEMRCISPDAKSISENSRKSTKSNTPELSPNRNLTFDHYKKGNFDEIITCGFDKEINYKSLKKNKNSEKKKSLLENSFIVLEQMPGQMNFQWADLSSKLVEDNYWASYNVPYFDQIRKLAGFSDMEEQKGGQSYSWKSSPRAVIFKAHARKVNCVEDLKKLMQLNPYYKGIENNSQDPENPTYSNRFDLIEREDLKKNVGAIDTKIANLDMVRNKKTLAISGPTYQNQEPFVWSLSKKNDPREGLPDKWMFPWVELNFNNEH